MSKTKTFTQILNFIENTEVVLTECPLLSDENVAFYKTVNADNYFQNFDYLLYIDDTFDFGQIDFLQIKKDEIFQLQKLYNTKVDKQKKLLILILLLIVLKQNAYYDIFDVNNEKYKLLFDPLFLPKNPKEKCFLQLIQYINKFLVDEFNNHPSEVIDSIYAHFKQMKDDCSIYNFLPFFLQILKDSDKELIQKFTDSDLFNEIIRISKNELPIYDFYRHIISMIPEVAFSNNFITVTLQDNFFDELKNQSIVISFERAINCLSDNNPITKEILIVFSSIIEDACKGDRSQLIYGLNTCIINLFNIISPEVDISNFLKAIATFAITDKNEESFEFTINLIRKLIIQRASFIFKLRNDKNFFDILAQYKKPFKFNTLFSLATCEMKYIPKQHRFIRLYQAIGLLLRLLPNIPDEETMIANSLFELSQNPGNIIELDHAKVSDFIIKRFPVIQDNEELREKYLKLFSIITSEAFDNTKFYSTIELVKNSEFKYSSEIFEILNKHLLSYIRNESLKDNSYMTFLYRCERLKLYNVPFSFFRFDNQTGCGIITPKMNLSGNFTFCFWIRLNDLDSDVDTPLIFFDHDKYHLDLYFLKNKIYLKYYHNVQSNEVKEIQPATDFDYTFEQGRWYFLCFSFKRGLLNNYVLSLDLFDDNSNKVSNKINFAFNTGEYKLYICRRPLLSKHEIDQPSLICDMSAFLFLSELVDFLNVRQNLIQYLSSNDRNCNKFDNLLCLFNPLESQDNFCFNVNKNTLRTPISGRTIPIITIFRDVIQNIGAINTLLPLINLISNDNDIEKAKKNLHFILSILANAINICELSFVKSRFFELLASFLYHCDKLIDVNIIKDLFLMFTKIHHPELQKSMIKSIYLNSEFLSRVDETIWPIIFSYSPLFLYDSREYHFNVVIEDLSLIIYRGVTYHDQISQQSKYFWNFLKKLCCDSPNDGNIQILTELLCSSKSEYIVLNILNILFDILYSKAEFNRSDFNFTPYIIVISRFHDSIDILELTLKIIQIVAKKIDLGKKLYSTVYQLIIVFNPSEKVLQESLEHICNMVLHMIMEEDIISFLPFLVTLLKRSNSLKLNQTICNNFVRTKSNIQATISTFPSWTYWLTNFYLQAFNPNENANSTEFADLCITSIDNTKHMIELLDFLDYYNGTSPKGILYNNEQNVSIDFTEVKEKILIYLISNDPNFMKNYSSYIYNFILFAVKNLRKTSNQSGFGGFIAELSNELDCDVSLRKSIDKELIKIMIRKTNANLKITKVQICEGKIEVPLKDAKTYLFSLLEKEPIENKEAETKEESNAKVEKYTKISNDILTKCLPAYKAIVIHKYQAINKDLSESFQFKRQYPDNEKSDAPIEEKLLYVYDPDKFEHYISNYPQFLTEQETKLKNDNNFLSKLKDSFLKIISKTPGPWENVNKQSEIKRFKMMNRVTKTGKKLMMKINNKFNDHSDASSNRGNNKIINENEKLVYKTLETLPFTSKHNNFKTKVVINSPSKQEDGTLLATETFITLNTETKNVCIYWEEVEFILNRRISHVENSCEIFKNNGRSYFVVFTECERKSFYSYIDKLKLSYEYQKSGTKFDFFGSLRVVCKGIYQNKKSSAIVQDLDLVNLWKKRNISTFSYLYYLNMLSGRTYNDLRQYPIFPFIITKSSDCFFLKDEQFYRDFSTPVSALNKEKLKNSVLGKYKEFPEDEIPYLFGELPSSALVVAWYLVRVEPYTTIHVTQFQNNGIYPRFDLPDRIFKSINSVIEYSKEFIPEFFYTPNLLVNENEFDLGVGSDHVRIQNVILPEWSRNSHCFISILRLMLEGTIADHSISKWIDIMFGTKRRTVECEGKEYNLYKSYSFPETPNPDFNQEVIQFGSMPEQLFTDLHPSRNEPSNVDTFEIPVSTTDFDNKTRFIKNILVSSDSSKALEIRMSTRETSQIYLPNICGDILCYSKCLNLAIFGTKKDPFLTVFNVSTKTSKTMFHIPSIITSVALAGGRLLVIGGRDCSIRVWDLSAVSTSQISSSCYHSDWINSIGCCYDNGILVSSDRIMTLVFETLVDHVFINSISLKVIKNKFNSLATTDANIDNDIELKNMISPFIRREDLLKDIEEFKQFKFKEENEFIVPEICVFKSGVVVVSQRNFILFFDHQGRVMSIKCFEDDILEMHKCYDVDTREFLIIGMNHVKIFVFDISLLTVVAIYDTDFHSISTLQTNCSFVTYYQGKVKNFNFSEYKSLMIKFQNVNPAHISK